MFFFLSLALRHTKTDKPQLDIDPFVPIQSNISIFMHTQNTRAEKQARSTPIHEYLVLNRARKLTCH